MPLEKGPGKAKMGRNYEKLKAEGKPPKQRTAIMLREAGVKKKAKK